MYWALKIFVLVAVLEFTSAYYLKRSSPEECNHVVVLDAGSTKTRAFIFYFTPSFREKRVIGTQTAKPSLSYYGNKKAETNKLRAGLRNLIAFAKSKISNKNCISQTKIVLKATAGLRQLPKNQAQRILTIVREEFAKSGFQFENEFAGILSGAEEGIYAWLGGNILLGKGSEPRSSWDGILDLGGGSTQVALIADADSPNSPNPNIRDFSAMGETVKLYSKSYPKGLNNARIFMLGVSDGCKKIGNCGESAYTSPCLHPQFKSSFQFGPARFSVAGESLPNGVTDRYDYCLKKANEYVKDVESVKELFNNKEFLAIAGFYYSINNAHFISNRVANSYDLSLDEIINLAKENCAAPVENDAKGAYYQSYVCLDLSYIIALLKNGYHFDTTNRFTISLKVDDIMVGWPVGIGMYYRNL